MSDLDMSLTDLYAGFKDIGAAKNWFYEWGGANEWLFLKINSIRGDGYDMCMQLLSYLASNRNFPYYMGAVLLCAILNIAWRKIRSQGSVKQHCIIWFGILLVLAAGFIVTNLTIGQMKDYFSYPRPIFAISEPINVLEQRDADDNHRSFPSGHASFITLMLVGLWPVLTKNARVLGVWLVVGVCWSRIALGVHFPADVIGGVIVALVVMSLARLVINWVFLRLFKLRFA